jgi:cytochrome c oxidase subunit 2
VNAGAGAAAALALAAALAPGCDAGAPPEALRVRVTGDEYQWRIRYPGSDGLLDTDDDVLDVQNLHVPVSTPIEVQLESTDYIYGFRIPDFGVNQMAVPELHFGASFVAAETGSYPLKGDQMCGFSHESLLGTVVVQTPSDFDRWQGRRAAEGAVR